MKKILIWVAFIPITGIAQNFDGVFKFQITAKYNQVLEKFIDVDTSYYPSAITKDGNALKVDGIVYDIIPKETIIDTFYFDEEKTYDIEYTCRLKNFDKYIVVNIVASNKKMYYFTIAKMEGNECIRKEYTNFEL